MKAKYSVSAVHPETSALKKLLEAIEAPEVLARQRQILIKPNLINDSPPPVTVPVELVSELIDVIRGWSTANIIVAEGVGAPHLETPQVFRKHGYEKMAQAKGVQLLDLNHAPVKKLERSDCRVFPSMHLPEILFESFVISLAMLKAHSLADVTLSMKNMLGCAPPAYYQQGGHWKKSVFHSRMHEAIFELNRYRCPDLNIIDARVGLAEYHLGGATCDPPVRKIIAGFDPVAVDAEGATLLGFDWRSIGHIAMADGVLGRVEESTPVSFPI